MPMGSPRWISSSFRHSHFSCFYGVLILKHGRRHMLWLSVTAHPTAEWIARQLTEACGWEPVPRYILRDRDSVYGEIFKRRLRAMGIRDRPTAPLQQRENTPIPEQGRATAAGCSGHRTHSSDSNSRRITPSLCSDLISDKDRTAPLFGSRH